MRNTAAWTDHMHDALPAIHIDLRLGTQIESARIRDSEIERK